MACHHIESLILSTNVKSLPRSIISIFYLLLTFYTTSVWAEKDWTQHPVAMCVDPDWQPLETITEDGEFIGIAADLLRLIFQRAELTFTIIPTENWDESLMKSRAGECDILALLNQTQQRSEWLSFTQPYLTNPNVLITRRDAPPINSLRDLANQRLVIPSGTSIYERVKRDYPSIVLLSVETEWDAFDMVDRGEADATLRSLMVAAYTIRHEGWFNLKIAAEIDDYKNLLRIGVLHQHTQLLDKLNQAIDTLTEEEINQAIHQHIPFTVTYRHNWAMISKIILASLLIIGLLLCGAIYQHRSKVRLIKLKTELETALLEKEQISERLVESERFYRSLVDTAHEGIAVIQHQRFVYANHYLAQMVGLSIEQLLALNSFLELVHQDYQAQVRQAHLQRFQTTETSGQRYQAKIIHSTGNIMDVEISGVIVDWYGEPASLNFISDITARKQAEREITHLANHDTLTGLANRRLLMERMEQLILQAKRNRIEFSVIFIDLDKFKPINDFWGHQVGDELLKAIANRLSDNLRASDTLARIGGDEFVILLPHLTSNHTEDVLKKIARAFQQPFELSQHTLSIQASLGAANYPLDGDNASELLNRADREMYRHKQANNPAPFHINR